MNIAIIGAGFTGLSAAYRLAQSGHAVTIFERDTKPGGLAVGYSKKEWDWTFEEHYHHWFSEDASVLSLAKEIQYPVLLKRPRTSVYVDGALYQLDSPAHVLSFPKLPVVDKVRMAGVLAALRFNPYWKPLERMRAHEVLPKYMGTQAYQMLWEPQLKNKFGEYYTQIPLSWFWARIRVRTPSLAYPKGGYMRFAEALAKQVERLKGTILYGSEVSEIRSDNMYVHVRVGSKSHKFDRLIFTGSSALFTKLAKGLSTPYKKRLLDLRSLGATNVVLRLKKQFMKDGTYWLSVCDPEAPIMAIVEHTNFMPKSKFNNEHLVYVGNYMKTSDKRFSMTKSQVLKSYDSFLKKINKDYRKHLIDVELFKAPFAQPIVPTNYSKKIPARKTPIRGVYMANMQQVYPWDRGTNYAVELGETVASDILEDRD